MRRTPLPALSSAGTRGAAAIRPRIRDRDEASTALDTTAVAVLPSGSAASTITRLAPSLPAIQMAVCSSAVTGVLSPVSSAAFPSGSAPPQAINRLQRNKGRMNEGRRGAPVPGLMVMCCSLRGSAASRTE